jgi:hypothetical protein
MSAAERKARRRDLTRALTMSAALAALLVAAAAAGYHQKRLRAFYCAARLVRADEAERACWLERLEALGPEAAGACQWAYGRASDPKAKERTARALGECAGLLALHDLVEREGVETPAEEALVDLLCYAHDYPPPEAEVIHEDPLPPPEDLRSTSQEKISLRYIIGDYKIEVTRRWERRFTATSNPTTAPRKSWSLWRVNYDSIFATRFSPDGSAEVVARRCAYYRCVD